MFNFKTSLTLGALCVLAGCSIQPDHYNQGETYDLTILHTNDHHGRFWHNKHGEYGMAARKTLIDSIRKEVKQQGGSLILLSGGDINTGVPESDLQDAEPDFKGMKKIGYDAMALGNHEFDNELAVLMKQQGWIDFPMLAANIYDKKTGKRLFEPYHIFNKKGVKIAVIGLTTEDTAKIGNPEYISNVEFRQPAAEAKKVIQEIKANNSADIIIAATHMGHYLNGNFGVNAPGDVSLARTLDPNSLDMIIGGHSQNPVCMEGDKYADFHAGDKCVPDRQNGVWIMQAFEWGKYVGRADFSFRDGKLELKKYALIPVNLKKKIKDKDGKSQRVFVQPEIKKDPALYKFLEKYQKIGGEKLNIEVAKLNGKLEGDRNVVRFNPTNLGKLVTAAQRDRAKADFAVMSSGGIRDSLESGKITYKDVLIVQPFANNLSYVDMKGDELLKYLAVVAIKPVDSGAYPQFSSDISMTIYKNKIANVKIKGKKIDPKQTYRIAMPSYNAVGGDGYPNLLKHKGYVNTGFVDAEVLKDYLQKHSPIDAQKYDPKGELVYKTK